MTQLRIAIGALLLVLPTGALAQGIEGGELSFGTFALGDLDDSFRADGAAGSLEYGITPLISLQGDASIIRYDGETAASLGFHGIVHLDVASVGGFVAGDFEDDADIRLYGLEATRQFGRVDVEGYIGLTDDGGTENTIFGLSGDVVLNDRFALGASFDTLADDDASLTRYGLEGTYNVSDSWSAKLNVGSTELRTGDASGSDPYVGLGLTYSFGPSGDTTFDRRGITSSQFNF